MKNITTKKVTKKTITKDTASNKPASKEIKLDITDIFTDYDMVYAIAFAKLDTDKDITSSEVKHLLLFENACLSEMFDATTKFHIMIEDDLRCEICRLIKKVNWLNRPWYKKLMFWKKEPACNCTQCNNKA